MIKNISLTWNEMMFLASAMFPYEFAMGEEIDLLVQQKQEMDECQKAELELVRSRKSLYLRLHPPTDDSNPTSI